jgi:O-antigen biosynthesis protein
VQITHERLTLGSGFDPVVEREHVLRYEFARNLVEGKDVLDIACGSGYGSQLLARAGARSVVGVDVSAEAVQYATGRHSSERLRFAVGNAESLNEIQDKSFDVVISFETIEHLNNVDRYLSEIRRVLRPGGIYVVSTPDRRLASPLYLLSGRPRNTFHAREFTRSELLELLTRRFEVQECLGQAYVNRALAFWPVQVFFKGFCNLLRRFGAYRFVERHYHLASGLEVRRRDKGIARFWLVKCMKPAE